VSKKALASGPQGPCEEPTRALDALGVLVLAPRSEGMTPGPAFAQQAYMNN
jgi:hypothetical protein